jgi:hypothetical protein
LSSGGSKFEFPCSPKLQGIWGRAKEKVEREKEGKEVKTWPGSHFAWSATDQHLEIPPTFVPHSNFSHRCSTNRPKAK